MIAVDMIEAQLSPLANHLWQSTLFAGFAGLLALMMRNNRAQTRYWIWLAASSKFLVPFSMLVEIGTRFGWQTQAAIPPSGASSMSSVIVLLNQPFAVHVPTGALPTALPTTPPAATNWILILLCLAWGTGFATVACSWLLRWRSIRVALRKASPLPLPIDIQALTSPAFSEPGVYGMLRPRLLMPTGIVDRLTPSELDAILAHELCHVRRHDNLTGAFHMLVEAVFWFHPLVWWLGARLMQERERACDEDVLQRGNEPQTYAQGILKICELHLESPLRCVAGVTGANLKQRIEAIMSDRVAVDLTVVKKLSLAVAGTVALAVPIVIGALNAPAVMAKSQPVAAQPRAEAPVSPVRRPLNTAPRMEAPQTAAPTTLIAQQKPVTPQSASVAPRAPEGIAVIVIIDRSSSMEGTKMNAARAALIDLVDHLRPIDTIGVLAFDNQFNWIIPLNRAENPIAMRELIAGIVPDGGTQIAPALAEGYAGALSVSNARKHIVLLTDGISEPSNSLDTARAANAAHVTISTIGLGRDVNRAYLEQLAQVAGGTAYSVTTPADLQQLLLRDIQEHTGTAAQ